MKNKLTQFFLLFTLFFSTQAFSNPINSINLVGLNSYNENSIIKLLPFKVGQNFLSSTSDKIIEELFKTGYFSDITVIKDDKKLIITLKENPNIKYFDIKLHSDKGISAWLNNEKDIFTNEDLKVLIDESELSTGNNFTERKLNNFITLLKEKYNNSGYFNVSIESDSNIDIQNRIGVELFINQGNRATISSFNISGSSVFTEKELLNLFSIGEPDFSVMNYFTNKDIFTDIEFRQGIDLLTNNYFDAGYLDFKILNLDINFSDDKEKMLIDIEISEGIQYKLGNISFEGSLDNINIENLENLMSMSSGDFFNRNLIINDIQNITDFFADLGYAFVEVNPITSEFLDTVDINFNISLNRKTYINRIIISGNTRTQDEVIRREIGISEGGVYSRSVLRESLLNLRRLGYFSDVQIMTDEVNNAPDKIDITFNVKETQTGAVSFSVSHSNNYGISIGAGIEEKNIFGSGNTLNADFKLSESFNKVSFYFMNPSYNEKRHSVSIGVFKSEINDDDVMTNSYEIDTTGASIGYGIPLTKDTRINTELVYTQNEIKCGTSFSSSSYEASQCSKKSNDSLNLNVRWSENSLNDYLYPTNGKSNNVKLGVALPIGDYRYISANAKHSSYRPINDNLTLKLTGDINIAKGYNGKQLPFFKRYFGGGSGSVRGFGNKSLGPLYPNGKAKGGELSLLGSANLITPAFFFENNEKMRMSAFIDTGNIYEKTSKINLGDLRMSAGFGFAYLSPIGSIGAFISTPILKKIWRCYRRLWFFL